MVKNCDLGLEMLPSAVEFQDLGHSFSPYGSPSRQITYIYCFKMICEYFHNSLLVANDLAVNF